MKFYSCENGGGGSLSHTEGGHKKFPPFKKRGGGREKV